MCVQAWENRGVLTEGPAVRGAAGQPAGLTAGAAAGPHSLSCLAVCPVCEGCGARVPAAGEGSHGS